MSGNGPSGNWIPKNNDACETLTQTLPLNSPNPNVLRRLSRGDRLDVASRQLNGSVIVEALYQGQVAGTITSTIFQRIAECIEQDYEYVAVVLEVNGGACKVKVQLK